MFYLFYREKANIDYNEIIENKNKEVNIDIIKNIDKICILCLENNDELFYDYYFKNNKYIHKCECTPDIHYECFKKYHQKKNNCIICLKNIDKLYEFKDSCNCYILLFKLSKFKFILFLFIFMLAFYNLLKDIDLNDIGNVNDLLTDDIH